MPEEERRCEVCNNTWPQSAFKYYGAKMNPVTETSKEPDHADHD